MENPDQDPYATHNNANGTIDVGLFQLNDRYLYTDFVPNYWDKDEEGLMPLTGNIMPT